MEPTPIQDVVKWEEIGKEVLSTQAPWLATDKVDLDLPPYIPDCLDDVICLAWRKWITTYTYRRTTAIFAALGMFREEHKSAWGGGKWLRLSISRQNLTHTLHPIRISGGFCEKRLLASTKIYSTLKKSDL